MENDPCYYYHDSPRSWITVPRPSLVPRSQILFFKSSISSQYYSIKFSFGIPFDLTGDLFLLVFSVDSRESFEEVVRLRTQIIETKCHIGGGGTGAGGGSSRGGTSKKGGSGLVRPLSGSSFRTKKSHSPNPIPMVIAGNKCDREMRYVAHLQCRISMCQSE